MCVHGDTVSYPTVVVHLQIGSWQREARVVVVPELPVPVLLGRDLYDQVEGGGPVQGFAVVTRSARRRAEQDAAVAGDSSQELEEKRADKPVTPVAELPTADSETLPPDTSTAASETQPPADLERDVTCAKGKVQLGSDLGLPATTEELKALQQSDPTLEKVMVSLGLEP